MKRTIKNVSQFTNKGFTLIELLVVIAIIGLLAAIVLASLGSARTQGQDTAVKAQLTTLRTGMENYRSDNGTYSGACESDNILSAITNANTSAGKGGMLQTATDTIGSWDAARCEVSSDASGWAAEAPLNASVEGSPSMWCVDSTGAAKQETSILDATQIVCS